MPPTTPIDQLVPRASGETSFGLPPEGATTLSLLHLNDGDTSADPATADLVWMDQQPEGPDHTGLLVLPSADERKHWTELHPDLATIMDAPAMVRLEVAATNVPARMYTVKIWSAGPQRDRGRSSCVCRPCGRDRCRSRSCRPTGAFVGVVGVGDELDNPPHDV
jgi:hypothetical protein